MEFIHFFIDFVLHLDVHLNALIQSYGQWVYLILFLIIFGETGFIVLPFLPGDSLLFVAGALGATSAELNTHTLVLLLAFAAVFGDNVNYLTARVFGLKLFANPNSKIFRRDHLTATEEFYAKHGGKTVVLARFIPIIRTFAPFVAGLGRMHYPRFLMFSVIGAFTWVGSLVYLGHAFGNIPFIKQNLSAMVMVIVAISLVPTFVGIWKQRQASRARKG